MLGGLAFHVQFVMARLDPAIHDLISTFASKTWITGASPVMTIVDVETSWAISRYAVPAC